jgi:hypothetical protein
MTAFVFRLIALVFLMSVFFLPFDEAHLGRICTNLGIACGAFGISFDTTRLHTKVRDWRIPRTTNVITATFDVMGAIFLVTGLVVWCVVG